MRGEDPIAAGVFDVDGGEATALLEGEMQAGDAIAVTVEQEGGSPSGLPTTDPVIVIPDGLSGPGPAYPGGMPRAAPPSRASTDERLRQHRRRP
ncbi:anti-sigma factor [Microbacterium sp. NRRL B-14842]|uniref:anti-sigma factor domain-containing protein n=1 Tax=Microbacterium sp. NRRL B-14842 TaxID=3162881 RepID=UPI003D2696DF